MLKASNQPKSYTHSKYLSRMKVKSKTSSAKNRMRPQTDTKKNQNHVFRQKENNAKQKVGRTGRNKQKAANVRTDPNEH